MIIRRSPKTVKTYNDKFREGGLFFEFRDGKRLRAHKPYDVGTRIRIVKNRGFNTAYKLITNVIGKTYIEVTNGDSVKTTYISHMDIAKIARSKAIGTIVGHELILSADGKRLMYLYRVEFHIIVGASTEKFILSSNVQILH